MAIIGITIDKENPAFTAEDFTIWMPQFKSYVSTPEGSRLFCKLNEIANNKIFKSIMGSDWELAMSYCIAHYMTLIAQQQANPGGSSLSDIAGGGATKGVLASASIGEFSKSYDLGKTMLDSQEALFWNQTAYGTSLMALYKTKALPSIFVVTNNPIPGAN